MIVAMPTTARRQQHYNHRVWHLVQRTGDVTAATDLGVPRSTARVWLAATPTVVVGLDVADLTGPEFRQSSSSGSSGRRDPNEQVAHRTLGEHRTDT
jgi:hypothetical protein